ncbi:MAG: flagellin [Planctomycetota bacterium]
MESVGRQTSSAEFNGDVLFDGATTLSVGEAELTLPDLQGSSFGETEIDGETFALQSASTALSLDSGRLDDLRSVIDSARSQVLGARGDIGSFDRNVLSPAMASNSVAIEQLSAARSVIRDTNFATETSNLSRSRILQTASLTAIGIEQQTAGSVISLLA